MKSLKKLLSEFIPDRYDLFLEPDRENHPIRLTISGHKVGKPSRRITFHQKGLRIASAEIWSFGKQGKNQHQIERINQLKNFEEVRLHSKDTLYPGLYKIKLSYRINDRGGNTIKLDKRNLSRRVLPSIDEPEAWAATEVHIKQ